MADISEYSVVIYERKAGTGARPFPRRYSIVVVRRAQRCVALSRQLTARPSQKLGLQPGGSSANSRAVQSLIAKVR
jgi:hypothetical protein